MDTDSLSPVWRKSDTRLVTHSVISFLLIIILGVFAWSIYSASNTPRNSVILGTETKVVPTNGQNP